MIEKHNTTATKTHKACFDCTWCEPNALECPLCLNPKTFGTFSHVKPLTGVTETTETKYFCWTIRQGDPAPNHCGLIGSMFKPKTPAQIQIEQSTQPLTCMEKLKCKIMKILHRR